MDRAGDGIPELRPLDGNRAIATQFGEAAGVAAREPCSETVDALSALGVADDVSAKVCGS